LDIGVVSDGAPASLIVRASVLGGTAVTQPYSSSVTQPTQLAGDCCLPATTAGCADPSVLSCVCQLDDSCCLGAYDALCLAEAIGSCGLRSCAKQAARGCCESSASAGCIDTGVEACVCDIDPYCCAGRFDENCVQLAEHRCQAACSAAGLR
jgi:hypothetical protein